jgi:hypothetical protein
MPPHRNPHGVWTNAERTEQVTVGGAEKKDLPPNDEARIGQQSPWAGQSSTPVSDTPVTVQEQRISAAGRKHRPQWGYDEERIGSKSRGGERPVNSHPSVAGFDGGRLQRN